MVEERGRQCDPHLMVSWVIQFDVFDLNLPTALVQDLELGT
jgi:hypothetical protein